MASFKFHESLYNDAELTQAMRATSFTPSCGGDASPVCVSQCGATGRQPTVTPGSRKTGVKASARRGLAVDATPRVQLLPIPSARKTRVHATPLGDRTPAPRSTARRGTQLSFTPTAIPLPSEPSSAPSVGGQDGVAALATEVDNATSCTASSCATATESEAAETPVPTNEAVVQVIITPCYA
jgi:hypothetical protein